MTLPTLPREVLYLIALSLDVRSLARLSQSNKRLHTLLSDNNFWQEYSLSRYPSDKLLSNIESWANYYRYRSQRVMYDTKEIPITAPRYITGSVVIDYFSQAHRVEQVGETTIITPLLFPVTQVLWSGGIFICHILYRHERELVLSSYVLVQEQTHSCETISLGQDIDYVSCTSLDRRSSATFGADINYLPTLIITLRRKNKLSYIRAHVDDLRLGRYQEQTLSYAFDDWMLWFVSLESVVIQEVIDLNLARIDYYLYVTDSKGNLYRGGLYHQRTRLHRLGKCRHLCWNKEVVVVKDDTPKELMKDSKYKVRVVTEPCYVYEHMFFFRRDQKLYNLDTGERMYLTWV